MPNILTLTVEEPDQILNAGAYGTLAEIQLQTSATEDGVFADVSGTGATPVTVVVTGVRSYTAYDPGGTVSSWYRTRYTTADGATRLSDWSPPFQVGDETGGLLCSVSDVEQELGRTLSANERELVLEKIRQVSYDIEDATGRWLAPRPTNPASTMTLVFRTEFGQELYIPHGIRTVSALGVASEDQPATSGTYITATASDYYIDPPVSERIDSNAPGKWIRFRNNPSGPVSYFVDAAHGASVTGSFGPAVVPANIQGIATRASLRRFLGKGAAGTSIAVGPTGTEFILPDLSGSDQRTLLNYTRWRF